MKRNIALLVLIMALLVGVLFLLSPVIYMVLKNTLGIAEPYDFPNKSVTITRIELLHNMNPEGIGIDESNMVLLRTLEGEEISEFMCAIYELPTKEMGTPPSSGYGEYIAKIVYSNGDIEMYGPYNIELIPAGGTAQGCGTHYFTGNGFTKLFAQYVDIYSLPYPPGLSHHR